MDESHFYDSHGEQGAVQRSSGSGGIGDGIDDVHASDDLSEYSIVLVKVGCTSDCFVDFSLVFRDLSAFEPSYFQAVKTGIGKLFPLDDIELTGAAGFCRVYVVSGAGCSEGAPFMKETGSELCRDDAGAVRSLIFQGAGIVAAAVFVA